MFQPMASILKRSNYIMKRNGIVISVISLLILASCKGNTSSSLSSSTTIENLVFDAENFIKPEANITSMQILNKPTEPIEIGRFSAANIKLQVNYVNDSTEIYVIDEDFFEGDSIDIISTVGKKHVTILFKKNHITFDFEMIAPKSPVYYTVQFLDYHGNIAYTDVVPYLKDAEYKGYALDPVIDGSYVYQFNGTWSEDITKVHKNLTVKPVYERRPITLEHEWGLIYPSLPYLGSYSAGYVFYLGRFYNFPLGYSDIYTHNSNLGQRISFEYEYAYSSLSGMFKSVFQNAIYNAYQYTISGSKYINIENEELFYFGEDSFNFTDDENGNFVSASNSKAPRYVSSIDIDGFEGYEYYIDGSHSCFTPLRQTQQKLKELYGDKTEYDYIYATDMYGYYRLTLTCQTDCYLIIDADKGSGNVDYSINQVRFGLFPNTDTLNIIKQHSMYSDFADEYHVPVKLDTSVIYWSLQQAI